VSPSVIESADSVDPSASAVGTSSASENSHFQRGTRATDAVISVAHTIPVSRRAANSVQITDADSCRPIHSTSVCGR
jgi:hypothetical protein